MTQNMSYHITYVEIFTMDRKLNILSQASGESQICDPLIENPAHPTFYENRDKAGNWCIDVQLCSSEKMETIGCLVPELWSETHRACGTQVFEKMQCFYVVTVYCNVSVYYRVM